MFEIPRQHGRFSQPDFASSFLRNRNSKSAFTVIELLASIAIIAILAVTVVWISREVLAKAEAAQCIEHMKSLHTSLAAYVQDNGHWPQEPEGLWDASGNNDGFEDWWLQELKPYGVTEKAWQCPTIMRRVVNKTENRRPRIHYTPTMFDGKAFTPFRWSTQPWLIEIGNMHGGGAMACFPDGSVRSMAEIVPGY